MAYVIFDLEWNQPVERDRMVKSPVLLVGEIIQIGAVKLDGAFRPAEEFRLLVKPACYKRMHYRIAKLTGIRTADLERGTPFPEACRRFLEWCGEDATLLTWGGDDIPMLLDNMTLHGMDTGIVPPCYNVQVIYDEQLAKTGKQCALGTALERVGEIADGAHDALSDARSTALICRHLDMRRGFSEYDGSRFRPLFEKPERTDRGKLFRKKESALADDSIGKFRCPACGEWTQICAMEGTEEIVSDPKGWISLPRDRRMAPAECPGGHRYLIRTGLVRSENACWFLKREIYQRTRPLEAYYLGRARALKKQEEQVVDAMTVYERWCAEPSLDAEYREELLSIRDNPGEIEERFYRSLEFGTAGLRGILGAGTNRMNVPVVRQATKGLAEYLKGIAGGPERGVCIAYDSRHGSMRFARETACVLAEEGIRTCLFESLRAVPQLSFAVRHLGCMAGVVITASHNPAKYNGYKVYWEHGGQCAPEQASAILEKINSVPMFSAKACDFDKAVAEGRITLVGAEEDEAYYAASLSVLPYPELMREKGKDLKLVYTPLHGTGNVPVREMLKRAGVTGVLTVREQQEPDGGFPTVPAPNPELPEAFDLAIRLAEENGVRVAVATDPDADRTGIAVKSGEGKWKLLTGNQIACLLMEHLLSARKEKGELPENGVVIKSLVSTQMADAIAGRYGILCEDVLTGFRFISEKIDRYAKTGEKTFLFGFEESYGFLAGGFSRDKDAILSSTLAAEACLSYGERGMTLWDGLQEMYRTYGYYREKTISYTLEGKAGIEKIGAAMKALRENSPLAIASLKVQSAEDYAAGTALNGDGTRRALTLPKADVLRYLLGDGNWAVVRPSGTEPKLKLYLAARGETEAEADELLEQLRADMDARLRALLF